jgi:hypothetical protein
MSDLLPARVNLARNADFVFKQFNVIGELKRLEKDQSEDKGMAAKIQRAYERWVAQGKMPLIGPSRRIKLNPRNLPLDCAHELVSLYREPIAHRIKTANKQIKSTKETLNMESAIGVLFLAQDGDYSIDPADVLSLVARVLNRDNYSSIDNVIYFNANRPALRRSDQSENLFWASAYRNGARAVPSELVTALSAAWHSELEMALGGRIAITPAGSNVSDLEDFHFPKGRS